MSTLRMQIAETQITIRQIKADLADAKQAAQGAAVTAAGGFAAIGKNKEEREFALEQAVNDSPAVKRYGRDLMMAEAKLTRLEAELADQQDDEQRDRWAIRAQMVDALLRLQIPQPASFFSGGEIDRVADEVSGEILVGGVAMTYTAQTATRLDPATDHPARHHTSADRYRAVATVRSMDADYHSRIDHEADELFG